MLVIIGACVVVLAILGGYLMEGGNPFLLFQPAEFVIIFGAAIGKMSFTFPTVSS